MRSQGLYKLQKSIIYALTDFSSGPCLSPSQWTCFKTIVQTNQQLLGNTEADINNRTPTVRCRAGKSSRFSHGSNSLSVAADISLRTSYGFSLSPGSNQRAGCHGNGMQQRQQRVTGR